MFEKATRLRIRWNTKKGLNSVEDLWILPLEELNSMYQDLRREQKTQAEDSLLATDIKPNDTLDLKIQIIKHIVEIRLAEQKALQNAVARKAEKEKLLSILSDIEDKELRGKSADEIRKRIEELG